MSIEGFIGGFMVIVASLGSDDSTKTLWNTAVMIDKANTKSTQGTWQASAHEEVYQSVKDTIKKIGEN